MTKPHESQRETDDTPPATSLWLRRADQGTVAVLISLALASMALYGLRHQGGWIEIDRAEPRTAHFQIDINSASWPEFAQLPEVGETLARRIVESRSTEGPFTTLDDLRRVPGIGPRTLERIRPYLLPIPPAEGREPSPTPH